MTDDEYYKWKERFESLTEVEKLSSILGVITQKEFKKCTVSDGVYESMVVCIHRYVEEKELEDF